MHIYRKERERERERPRERERERERERGDLEKEGSLFSPAKLCGPNIDYTVQVTNRSTMNIEKHKHTCTCTQTFAELIIMNM